MGQALEFTKEKLIVGIIYHDEKIYKEALSLLSGRFGEIEGYSEVYSFSKEYTDYYDRELGGEGMRQIISFKECVDPALAGEIKELTNEIERRYSDTEGRKINLDPGLMNQGRLTLMSTKDSGFRIPLKDGIYAELTLFFARGSWQKLPWTYRDYQSSRTQDFLLKVRKSYMAERKVKLKEK